MTFKYILIIFSLLFISVWGCCGPFETYEGNYVIEDANVSQTQVLSGAKVISSAETADDAGECGSIETLSGSLIIQDTNELISLEEAYIPSIDYVSEDLIIDNNAVLENLLGLFLESVGGDFIITNNPALCTDFAESLRNQVEIGGAITISGNKDCSTP